MKRRLFCIVCFILTPLLILCACSTVHTDIVTTESTTVPEENTAHTPVGVANPLTGLDGFDEIKLTQKSIGIVVENHPSARPQWGMSTPDIVVEYEVEGGISRMLWLYADINDIPSTVGPVRSARHDVAELALGWDLLFVHCGDSNIAHDFFAAHSELTHIDAMYSEVGFQRDKTRNVASEHRLTLLGDAFRSTLADRGLNLLTDADKKSPFTFASPYAPRTLSGTACMGISISYSANYSYEFKYNMQTAKFDCFINGSSRTDDSGTQCSYSNVIILHTDMAAVGDSSGHQDLKLENGGTGYYLNSGVAEEITWTKTAVNEPLRLFAKTGEELILNTGNSYIGFVRSTQSGKTVLEPVSP